MALRRDFVAFKREVLRMSVLNASQCPGEEIAAAFPIFYGALGWTFDRPGTYRVTAEYRHPSRAHGEPVRSVPVAVTVAGEAGIGALLMTGTSASEEAGKFLLWQRGDQLQAGQALVSDLFKTYPDSPLADYALLALGRNLSRSFRNYAAGRIRVRQQSFSAAC